MFAGFGIKKARELIAMFRTDAKIFVAYEDAGSFAAVSGIGGKEKVDAFSFSGFWNEQSWGNAVTAANQADVIIVSLSGQANLPVPVRRWMENLPDYKHENHNALVVMFGNEAADRTKQNVLISFFQQIAESHGLDFVCHGGEAKNISIRPETSEPAKPVKIHHAERLQAPPLLAIPAAG
jgi:hypothetical protein